MQQSPQRRAARQTVLLERRSLKSSNPVLSRWRSGRTRGGTPTGPSPAVAVSESAVSESGAPDNAPDRSAPDGSAPYREARGARPVAGAAADVMTMNDVIVRTAATLGTAVLGAVLSWTVSPVDPASTGASYSIAATAALTALAVALVQTFRSRPTPALILTYAAFEGVFLGVLSATVSTHLSPGVVVQVVLGTMAVFAAVLVAYRLSWIEAARRLRGFALAAFAGLLLLAVADLVFSAFTEKAGLGFRSGGPGVLLGVVGVVLGALFLALHFRQVEDGIAAGAPRKESWTVAFGLTVTLVWLYAETPRLLTLVREDDDVY